MILKEENTTRKRRRSFLTRGLKSWLSTLSRSVQFFSTGGSSLPLNGVLVIDCLRNAPWRDNECFCWIWDDIWRMLLFFSTSPEAPIQATTFFFYFYLLLLEPLVREWNTCVFLWNPWLVKYMTCEINDHPDFVKYMTQPFSWKYFSPNILGTNSLSANWSA